MLEPIHIARSVDFKQTYREGERVRGRKVRREGVNFKFHFRSDNSAKYAIKDGTNHFWSLSINSNNQTFKIRQKSFDKILKKGKGYPLGFFQFLTQFF